jgi:ketoreductase RED2
VAAESSFSGKVALVTGSSSGIGEATARALAAEGARVMVNSAHSVEAGQALAAEVDGYYVQADIAEADAGARLVQETLDICGRLDILVNNAGTTQVIPHADLEAATVDIWRRIFEVNVFGTWAVTVAAMPHLKETGDGAVVNVTSLAGVRATGSSIPYASSKAALNHMTALLANVCGPSVRVNAVAPGLIDTPWTETFDAVRHVVTTRSPLARSGAPGEVAATILGVLRSTYMTGQVVVVDGGFGLT